MSQTSSHGAMNRVRMIKKSKGKKKITQPLTVGKDEENTTLGTLFTNVLVQVSKDFFNFHI